MVECWANQLKACTLTELKENNVLSMCFLSHNMCAWMKKKHNNKQTKVKSSHVFALTLDGKTIDNLRRRPAYLPLCTGSTVLFSGTVTGLAVTGQQLRRHTTRTSCTWQVYKRRFVQPWMTAVTGALGRRLVHNDAINGLPVFSFLKDILYAVTVHLFQMA